MLKTPHVSLRPWNADHINPCAPQFQPSLWNDSVNGLQQYRIYLDTIFDAADVFETKEDLYDHIDFMAYRFGLFTDADNSNFFDLPTRDICEWRNAFLRTFNTIQYSNNCYSYAWNDSSLKLPGTKPHIGYRSEQDQAKYHIDDMNHHIESDGMVYSERTLPSLKDDFYVSALFIRMNTNGHVADIHWLREDRDRSYSQKYGFNVVQNTDHHDMRIWAPHVASTRVYQFHGYFYTPSVRR